MSPDWAYPWLRTGLVLRRLGRLAEALEDMRRPTTARRATGASGPTWVRCWRRTGAWRRRARCCEALVRDYPVYLNGWYNLALVELQAGDRAAAAAAAEHAAALHTLTDAERARVARLRESIARAG